MKKNFGSSILVALIASAAFAFVLAGCSNGSDSGAQTPATKYTVTISTAITNGSVTADKTSAAQGETVTLTANPASGYKLDKVTVTDSDGTAVPVTDGKFTMPAKNVTVTATFVVLSPAYTKIDTVTINGKQYDIVTFGSWPQTIKAANVEVSEQSESKTVGAFTYYKGSDGQWYAKVKENAYENGYKYSDGSAVAQSSADSYKWFKEEPIKWRVLTTDFNGTGRKLLLAENILTNCAYYDCFKVNRSIDGKTVYNNNCEHSKVRSFLNGRSYQKKESASATQAACDDFLGKGFLQAAFTVEELATIADTSVDNSARSTLPDNYDSLDENKKQNEWGNGNNQYACDTATTDKLFILSEREATKSEYGFDVYNACKGDGTHNESARIRVATDYAKAKGAYQKEGMGGLWWLRSPSLADLYVYRVDHKGNAYSDELVTIDSGVVPALCVSN